MKEEYMFLSDAIINLFDTIRGSVILLAAAFYGITLIGRMPAYEVVFFAVLLYCLMRVVAFCLIQVAAIWHPRWFDIDQVMEEHGLCLSYGLLDDVEDNPEQNGKFWEYDFVSSDETNDALYASMLVDAESGMVMALSFPHEADHMRAVIQMGPSFGLHPSILLGKIDENGPEVVIEEELALLLTHAIRASKPEFVDESPSDNRSYFERNCYGAARYRRFVGYRRAHQSYPSSHDMQHFNRNE